MTDHFAHNERRAEAQEAAASARQAVSDARAAVEATTDSLDRIADRLRYHFRLWLFAVVVAVLIGGMLLHQGRVQHRIQRDVQRQAVANQVAVLRQGVNDRVGDQRLCTIALGASRPAALAAQICAPVLGDDFAQLEAKLRHAVALLAES